MRDESSTAQRQKDARGDGSEERRRCCLLHACTLRSDRKMREVMGAMSVVDAFHSTGQRQKGAHGSESVVDAFYVTRSQTESRSHLASSAERLCGVSSF